MQSWTIVPPWWLFSFFPCWRSCCQIQYKFYMILAWKTQHHANKEGKTMAGQRHLLLCTPHQDPTSQGIDKQFLNKEARATLNDLTVMRCCTHKQHDKSFASVLFTSAMLLGIKLVVAKRFIHFIAEGPPEWFFEELPSNHHLQVLFKVPLWKKLFFCNWRSSQRHCCSLGWWNHCWWRQQASFQKYPSS